MKRTVPTPCCCSTQSPTKSQSAAKRFGRAMGWLGPGVVLVLMPKCPVCVAGYVAVLTGIGISLPTAAVVRFTLKFLCIAALAFMVWKRARQHPAPVWFRRRHAR